jgi:cytochrome c oxidase subunit II
MADMETHGSRGVGVPGTTTRRGGGFLGGDHHWRRLIAIWFVLSAVIDPLFWFFVGKYVPPGTTSLSTTANGATFDADVMCVTAIPVMIAVYVYFVYAIVNWRHQKGTPLTDGSPLRGHGGVQTAWILITTAIVTWAFIFGTYELVQPGGAGGGEGADPLWTPTSHTVLPIQVIGQQWYWTFRYPTFGGFETPDLVVPNHTTIAFHVTSLDVVHDFWAYQIGVKADANPDYDDVAYTTTTKRGTFAVRCDELCGIWHGAMYTTGKIVSKTAFEQWAKTTESKEAPLTETLPKFAWTYAPSANPVAAYAEGGSRYSVISPTLTGSTNCYSPTGKDLSGGKDLFSKTEIAPYQGEGKITCKGL